MNEAHLHSTTEPSVGSRESQLGSVLQFMRLLWGLDHQLKSASKRMDQRLGITGPQRLVLRILGKSPGISAGDIAKLLHLHPSTLTGVLQRLEKRKALKRLTVMADRRRAGFELTQEGAKLCEAQYGTVEEAVERALRRIDTQSLEALRQIVAAVVLEIDAQKHTHGSRPKRLRQIRRASP